MNFSNFSSSYTPEKNGVAERKTRTLIEAARIMLSRSDFSKQYWTEAVATAYTQNRFTILQRHLKTPYEVFHKRILNINFLYVFGCPLYIHNHKDHLVKFDEKDDDGYLIGYSLVSKAFRVFTIRKQQIEETYHITFDESPDAIKFSKPVEDASVQNTSPIANSCLSIPSLVTPAPQDRWSQYKHIELVNIISDPGDGMLSSSMPKELGAVSAHECLFVYFLSEEEPKKFYAQEQSILISNIIIRDYILKGDIELHFIPTQYQLADIFTKPLDEPTFKRLIVELCEIKGDIGINTFRNALRAHYLSHSSKYVLLPSITIARPCFATTGYSGEIREKGTLKKSFLPPRWRLLMGQIIQCLGGKTGGLDQISNKDATILYCLANVVVPQGKKPEATSRLKRNQSLKHTSESKTEASKSKTGQSKMETFSCLAKDKSPSHPLPPTPVVGEMHKEAQQAVGGPTSLGASSKDEAHPQLSSGHDALADSTANADLGNSAPNHSIPSQQDQTKSARDGLKTTHSDSGTNEESRADDISKKIKLEDLSNFLKDTITAFFTPDSPQDELIIISDESEEEKSKKDDTHATSHDVPEDNSFPHPPSLKLAQIQELMAWDLLTEFQVLPVIVSLVQQKLKNLDSLPSLLNKVTKTLKRFSTVVENASRAATTDVPSADQATASPTEGEKNTTKDAETNQKNELVDLLGTYVVT
nr:retrovirus-related Pol polyprotein from transposon TNT 1-94 [Tanacetum cinerariifolium]